MKYAAVALVALSLGFAATAQAQVRDTYIIPAAANASGANGTHWATDFHLFNPQSYPLKVRLDFLPTGGTQGSEVTFTVQSNRTAFADDVLAQLFSTSGTGALTVSVFPEDNPTVPNNETARAFVVTTKTFNNASSGTFGQAIAGVRWGLQNYSSDQISAIAPGITNSSSTVTGYRANIGAVNLGRFSATLFVSVYDDDGHTIANQLPFVLPPQGHFQDRLPVSVEHGSVEFFVSDSHNDAVVFPYVSVIDNRSGDPQYVSPILLASPSILGKMAPNAPLGTAFDLNIARTLSASNRFLGEATVDAHGRVAMQTK